MNLDLNLSIMLHLYFCNNTLILSSPFFFFKLFTAGLLFHLEMASLLETAPTHLVLCADLDATKGTFYRVELRSAHVSSRRLIKY